MEIIVPEPTELDTKTRRKVTTTAPSFGQTLSSQYSRIIDPIANQNKFYTSTSGDYDADSIPRVEEFIVKQNLGDEDARYLRTFGIGNLDNFQSAMKFIENRSTNRDILSRSTGVNLFLSDPSLHFSLIIPYVGFAAAAKFGKAASHSGFASTSYQRQLVNIGPIKSGTVNLSQEKRRLFREVLSAKTKMQTTKFSTSELARISALDAAVVDGSVSLSDALTEISGGEDPLSEITNAALYTAGATAVGALLGYGFGKFLNRPKNSQTRQATFNKGYRNYLNSVSERPAETGKELSYAGAWFANSWFMKAAPTPIRSTVNDKALARSEWAIEEMLAVGGDNGMPFVANQMGKSIGNSVNIEAGRRQGDWFKALDVINENYRSVSPRGSAEFLNVPVGEYVEKVRRMVGKDSFAPDEWYTRIGRLMIDEVPFDKMTPQEAASVQAARSFFEKYANELEEIGLLNPKDVFEDSYLKNVGRQMQLQSVTKGIINQNKKWMTPQLDKFTKRVEDLNNKLKNLNKTATTRGLTNKQVELKEVLEKELIDAQDSQAALQDLFNKIDNSNSIEDLSTLYNQLNLTDDMRRALAANSKAMDETRARIDNALDVLQSKSEKSPNNYLMRIFNRRKIGQETEAFKKILVNYFRDNPEIISKDKDGFFVRQELATDPISLDKRAQDTIDNILGEVEEDTIDAIFTGYGRSGPLVSRRLNIPNHLIKDFIVTDIKEVMISYTNRVAPKIEYHKRFRDPKTNGLMTLEARLDYLRERLKKDGVNQKSIDKYIKNFVAIYDQVVGTKLKRPDAIDTKVADFLRTATSWTFLGGSGLAAIGDAASVFMDHELNVIGKSFLGMMDDVSLNLAKRELNLAGEALEITLGTTHLKYLESLTNDVFSKSIPDKLNNAFYIANGLAPVTVLIKTFDGLLRGHTIIEASTRLVNKEASKFEIEFLARYNITPDLAKKISESPYETSSGGLFLPNTEAWADESAVIGFRNALRSGVINRVIMGTPADKPIPMGGVAYIPESIAKTLPFELPVDPRVQGYRRVESGLLALPFTFYSYTMGALSKITANHASGSVRNRLAHVAVAMGLGSMIVQIRTPSWAYDKMDTEDKIMRAFDFSGLAAIYTDMAYRAITMASETGMGNNFPIQPKFAADEDKLGAAISIAGAPADWTYEVLKGIGQMLEGDVQDGAKQLIKVTPLLTTIATGDALKDMAKEMTEILPNRP